MPKVVSVLRSGRAIAAEFVSTALLVMLGCMSCTSAIGEKVELLQIAIAFGLVVMFNVQIFGHVSGAHMNPAVTLAAVLYGKTPAALGLVFVVVQNLGALVGFGGLRLLIRNNTLSEDSLEKVLHSCSTIPSGSISGLQATAIEFFITLILILLCCAVWDPVNANNTDCVPLKFGLTITSLCLIAGSYTGASLNPARSLGPAVWNGDWERHYVYWVGPLLAAPVGAYGYKLLSVSDVRGGNATVAMAGDGAEEIPLAHHGKDADGKGAA